MTDNGLWCRLSVLAAPLHAAPYTPQNDAQVLERLPARADDPRMRGIAELRRQLARSPQDADLAVSLAQRYFEQAAAEGDPRYIGYAQAALAPWWLQAEPPVEVRVERVALRFEVGTDPKYVAAVLHALSDQC